MKLNRIVVSVIGVLAVLTQIQSQAVPTSFDIRDDIKGLEDTSGLPSYTPIPDPHADRSYVHFYNLAETSLFKKEHELHGLPPLPSLTQEEAYQEAARLTALLKKTVPNALIYSSERNKKWVQLAQDEMDRKGPPVKRAQLLIVVDRNPKVQELCFVLAFPKGQGEWKALGGGKVSTGNTGRKLYYITPTGVFYNTVERIGYRALGTKNKNGIRGNGIKGMRVWDFGWQWAEKGWLPNREKGQIRLEMHATDPDYLEQRLGKPASEGCVRLATKMNEFIDHNGIIDALYTQAAHKDKRFSSVLSKKIRFTPLAGDKLVVVDSSHSADSQRS
ncbi:L,D-transpeptidase [Commensalibacter communis]|uniref:L,D-transpeptidase n=1 Tax=Commensalibacter communis TaxID=2972786 RepID=UPI0022FFB655|nr:L,D-transpeptidase [Commensalibacter communis]CAI3938447.1 unnamed protein product [Commensalibacter communis]CAI3939784.1 unnamed protein product [Commensalibacter communis]